MTMSLQLALDLLTWLIVGGAACYVGRAAWRRVRALLAAPAPDAQSGVPGPLGSTLAQPGRAPSACDGCSAGCGKPSGHC